MFPKTNPTSTQAWKALSNHFEEMKPIDMRQLFTEDPARFKACSLESGDILFDYSKNNINSRTKELLLNLAEECHIKDAINAING